MTALRAFCELNEKGDRIEVHFSYNPAAVEAIRAVSGRRFHDIERDGRRLKFWSVPATLTSAQRLREEFGQGLQLGDGVKRWGHEEVRRQRNLGTLVTASDAELTNVSSDAAAWLRPYQRADVKMMALTNVLNANQPGVGKTVEVIYAIQEAQLKGPHLIIAPISLHFDPWMEELMEHAPEGTTILYGDTASERADAITQVHHAARDGEDLDDTFLIINPDLVRLKKWTVEAQEELLASVDGNKRADEWKAVNSRVLSRDHKGHAYLPRDGETALLHRIPRWGAVVLDEFHKHGLGEDRNTLYARAVEALGKKADRRYALSGTPMGGKPVRLWGCLYFIEPQQYGSKWRWAEDWLVIDEEGRGKKIGQIQPGREDEFYKAHAKHMVRRTRKEALPGLPDKNVIDVDVKMTPKQAKVYREFEDNAEVMVEGGRVASAGILAEYARLKQFANALCHIVDGDVHPTRESGKLPALLERLDNEGLRKDNPEPNARAVVASESRRMVEMVAEVLREEGLNVAVLLGGQTPGVRRDLINWYKKETDDARILVMTTQTGGVGLNLGMTGSIHILDETWNPDDQEQLEDRGMRDRTTVLNIYYYRTVGTIQEYIADIAATKFSNNETLLDSIRQRVAERRNR